MGAQPRKEFKGYNYGPRKTDSELRKNYIDLACAILNQTKKDYHSDDDSDRKHLPIFFRTSTFELCCELAGYDEGKARRIIEAEEDYKF